ncbi:hypothetical protein BYT27DRAFT_7248038 [Phlegmacium glaucopus]|nr:hypothetical protein BYT27DRAFT_7248038 [Phlegmacium glaucopus]
MAAMRQKAQNADAQHWEHMQEHSREPVPQQCQNPPKAPTPSSSSSVPSSNPSSNSGKQSQPSDQKSAKPADSGKTSTSAPPKPNLAGHCVPDCNLAKASSAKGQASTISDSTSKSIPAKPKDSSSQSGGHPPDIPRTFDGI